MSLSLNVGKWSFWHFLPLLNCTALEWRQFLLATQVIQPILMRQFLSNSSEKEKRHESTCSCFNNLNICLKNCEYIVHGQIKGPICTFFENLFFSENSSKGPNAHMASEIGVILAQLEGKM
jgi:hypothetical protein